MVSAPLALIDIDLAKGLRSVSLPAGMHGACIVFWWGDRPLGRTVLAAGQFPLPIATLACHAAGAIASAALSTAPAGPLVLRGLPDPGWRDLELGKVLRAPPPSPSAVETCAKTSIIVCTRGRPQDAIACIESLRRLDPPPLEIVVVDNAHPGEPQFPEELVQPVRVVRHPGGGLSAARNAGVAAARGAFVAFTDDDAVVRPGWLVRLLEPFADPGTGCVTGLVLPLELATEAQVTFEFDLGGFHCRFSRIVFDEAFLRRTLPRGTPAWEIGAGAAMAFRREALEAAGPFDLRLGAGASGCSEDSEMWYRLLAQGWTCVYEPLAVAFHRHRVSWPELERQAASYMRGHVAALLIQYRRYGHVGNLRRAFCDLPRAHLQIMLVALFMGNRSRLRLATREAVGILQGFRPRYWTGRVKGAGAGPAGSAR